MDSRDSEHLRTLSICHYVLSAMKAGLGLILFLPLLGGILLLANPGGRGTPPPGAAVLFIVGASVGILLHAAAAVFLFLSGRNLASRKRHALCMIVSIGICVFAPLGTILGVFTLLVLTRPSVKAQFA